MKRQTARKSTRSRRMRVTSLLTHFEEDMIEEQTLQVNEQELMTDDERTDDTNVLSSDPEASGLTDESKNTTGPNESNSSVENINDTIRKDIENPRAQSVHESESNNLESHQDTLSSTQSDFIVSIDSTEVFHTPPQSITREDSDSQATTSNVSDNVETTTKKLRTYSTNQPVFVNEPVEETGWISYETVHMFKYKFKAGESKKNKIAAFDLDGTLITPKSKNKFSRDINDWKLLDGRLKSKIKLLVDEKNFAFVIFSNQMGVSSKFITLNQIKLKFKNIIQSIDIPCVAFLCTHLDKNRKPAIGMFELYKQINREIDHKNSFFVGDAMGRQKDHSAADILFAYNCKLPFIPIESFLSGFEEPKLYNYDLLKKLRIPKFPHLNRSAPPRIIAKGGLGSNETTEFCFIEEEMIRAIESFVETKCKSIVILLIGLFGSGKTFFFNKYLAPFNYKSIAYNPWTGSLQDELKQFNNFVQNDEVLNKRIVIDQPNLTIKQRKKWIDLAKQEGYEVFAFHLDVPVDQCAHLVRFRSFYVETDRKAPTQNEIIKQSLTLQPPNYEEGFRTIYVLDFFENFDDPSLQGKQMYYYHYLYDKP